MSFRVVTVPVTLNRSGFAADVPEVRPLASRAAAEPTDLRRDETTNMSIHVFAEFVASLVDGATCLAAIPEAARWLKGSIGLLLWPAVLCERMYECVSQTAWSDS